MPSPRVAWCDAVAVTELIVTKHPTADQVAKRGRMLARRAA